jgi:hypothetical protein
VLDAPLRQVDYAVRNDTKISKQFGERDPWTFLDRSVDSERDRLNEFLLALMQAIETKMRTARQSGRSRAESFQRV